MFIPLHQASLNFYITKMENFCYALTGNCSYLYVPSDEEEPLVQRITTYEGKDDKAQLVSDVIKKEDQEG